MLQIYSFSCQIFAPKSKITQFLQPAQISKEAAQNLSISPLWGKDLVALLSLAGTHSN